MCQKWIVAYWLVHSSVANPQTAVLPVAMMVQYFGSLGVFIIDLCWCDIWAL